MPIKPPIACRDCDYGICVKHGQVPAPPEQPPQKKLTPQKAYQHLYDSKRWRDLRAACLRHDPMCVDPFKIGCHNVSTVADHKRDHHGNQQLFYDFTNLQGLCQHCHHVKTRLEHDRHGNQIGPVEPVLVNGTINGDSQE